MGNSSDYVNAYANWWALRNTPSNTTRLICPLIIKAEDNDGQDGELTAIAPENFDFDERAYEHIVDKIFWTKTKFENAFFEFAGNESLRNRIRSILPSIEKINGCAYGVMTVAHHGKLDQNNITEITRKIRYALFDGWCSGFADEPVLVDGRNYYIFFGGNSLKPENDFFSDTQHERKDRIALAADIINAMIEQKGVEYFPEEFDNRSNTAWFARLCTADNHLDVEKMDEFFDVETQADYLHNILTQWYGLSYEESDEFLMYDVPELKVGGM